MDKGDGSIKYILTGEGAGTTFTIDDSTGDIHAIQRLDREVKAQYILRAQARNRLTDRPLEPESEFIVKIQDINDNEPRFLDGPYQASVPEMSKIGEQWEMKADRWMETEPKLLHVHIGVVFQEVAHANLQPWKTRAKYIIVLQSHRCCLFLQACLHLLHSLFINLLLWLL